MTRFIYGWMVWMCLGLGFIMPLHAQAAPRGLEISTTDNGSELLTFNGISPVEVKKTFLLSNPDRVVIDIARVGSLPTSLPKGYSSKLLKVIRFGQFDATTSRIVLDVKVPASVLATQDGAPFTIEIAPAGRSEAPEVAAAPARPLVIIDAGHGGQDPGAHGIHNTQEKDITLNYARALKTALVETGRYRVSLTRDSDYFVTLQDRVSIARKQKGDIFISFHADSNPRPEARGLSIYTLSENASDDEAAALADRENKSDIIAGIDLNTTDADVASILIDLTQRETMNKSAQMADAVVASLHGKITKLQKTHRFAGFRVLKAPDIPSVLIELGFLSNETDERLLLTPEYRALVIHSVVKGIDRFRAGE